MRWFHSQVSGLIDRMLEPKVSLLLSGNAASLFSCAVVSFRSLVQRFVWNSLRYSHLYYPLWAVKCRELFLYGRSKQCNNEHWSLNNLFKT
ncbi:hypothetical protein GQX74_009440 [Glossina fuscipes]|nr:hypothetical protein GQX74_009440 [Glossina fuscipes]